MSRMDANVVVSQGSGRTSPNFVNRATRPLPCRPDNQEIQLKTG